MISFYVICLCQPTCLSPGRILRNPQWGCTLTEYLEFEQFNYFDFKNWLGYKILYLKIQSKFENSKNYFYEKKIKFYNSFIEFYAKITVIYPQHILCM